jgi:hypothetical protein
MMGVCDVQTKECAARDPYPLTVVWEMPARRQINVCRPCLEEMVRTGDWIVPGSRIPARWDFGAFDKSGNLLLAIEVKTSSTLVKRDFHRWALQIRRNLLLHSALPHSDAFLIICFPDALAFWPNNALPEDAAPAYEYVGDDLLDSYAAKWMADASLPQFRRSEGAVDEWLHDVRNGKCDHDESSGARWLRSSGLFGILRNEGTIIREADPPALAESRH